MGKGPSRPPGIPMPMNRQEAVMKFEKYTQRAQVHYEELSESTNVARQIIMMLTRDYETEIQRMVAEADVSNKYTKALEDHIEKYLTVDTPPGPVRADFEPKPLCPACGMEQGHKKDCPNAKPQ